MDAIKAGAEIEGARAERVVDTPWHETRQIGPSHKRFSRRPPIRPLAFGGDGFDARP